MFMLNPNEPIKVAHLQKLSNKSILNGALVIEMVYNYRNGIQFFLQKQEKLWSFDKARNVLIKKNRDTGSEKSIFRLLSKLLRSGRTAKLLMFR